MGDHFFVTGGQDSSAETFAEIPLNTVVKYSQTGEVEPQAPMVQKRYGHACSSYLSDEGETVGFT